MGPVQTGVGARRTGGERRRSASVAIGLVTDHAEHPVLSELSARLAELHDVVVVDPEEDLDESIRAAVARPLGLCLLKAHSRRALRLARALEGSAIQVVNRSGPTARALDRELMASDALGAGLPFPPTAWAGTVADLVTRLRNRHRGAPLVVKSRWSRRGDVVACVTCADELEERRAPPDEPVVVQDFRHNDGWDYKLYVVGGRVLAARRRSPLGSGSAVKVSLRVTSLPPEWVQLARIAGTVFDLDVYGVDLLRTPGGPLIVDVNPFPGGRGIGGMAAALAEFASRLAVDARGRRTASVAPGP